MLKKIAVYVYSITNIESLSEDWILSSIMDAKWGYIGLSKFFQHF